MKLVVTKNNQVLQSLELDPEIEFPQVFLLGRAPHCHICIQDSNLSREHGQFTLEDKKLYYQEQGHSSRIPMKHAQSIAVGTVKVQFDNPVEKEIKLEVNKPEPEIQIEEISINENPLEEIKLSDNNLEYENDHQKISSDMLEETLRLNSNNNFSNESQQEPVLLEPMGSELETPMFEQEQEQEVFEQNNEMIDADATRVIADFVKYQLILSGANIPFERYQITKPVTLIGRNNKCDIVLNDTEVSSQHAKFILKNNNLVIEDLKSVNGITVNGQKVNLQELAEGDIVTICSVSFLVKVQSDFIEAEKDILMPVDLGPDADKTQEFSLGDFVASESVKSDQEQVANTNKKNKNLLQDLLDRLPLGELKNNPKRLGMYLVMFIFLFMILFVDSDEENSETVVVKKESKNNSNRNVSKEENDNSEVENVPTDQNNKTEVAKEEIIDPETQNYLNSHYSLAMSYLERGDYVSAISEIDLVMKVNPVYKDITSLHGIAKDGLAKIEEQERKRKEEEERIARKKEIDELILKIEEAMKNQNLNAADVYISQVMAIDPENIRVSTMRIEIDAIREDIKKRAEEEALKKELRKKMVASLTPGKSFFVQKEWYKAIIKLSDFLSLAGMDEDLVLEASSLLKDAKRNLESEITSPLENARQYKNAQDLKNAYEQYSKVLQHDPSHEEALIASREIKEVLMTRAKIVYRQALVSESISHFRKAKEKFQEVLLIAPSDSEYYKKAEDKLKNIYLE